MNAIKWLPLGFALVLGLGFAEKSEAGMVYLGLGDSITFGQDPSTPVSLTPSFADQGFVRPFANSLAGLNGGIRPTVLNLGVSGEQSTSFFSAVTTPASFGRAWQLNQNYPNSTTSQNALMLSSIDAIHAAGNSIGAVTFQIGSNDINALTRSSAFQTASPADQQRMIVAAIRSAETNFLTVLSELKAKAPEATLILPDNWNSFPLGTSAHAASDGFVRFANQLIQADAQAYGAKFVDLYPLFLGRELQLTNLATGDTHPNQAGYAVIANALSQSVVPEPSSLVLAAVGLGSLGVVRVVRARQRDRRAVPSLLGYPH